MDSVTIIATVVTFAGAVSTSYEEILKVVALVQNAPKEFEAIRFRAASINDVVANLKQALEERATCQVIERDKRALDSVRALDEPLKAVECTLDEVVDKLKKQTRPTTEEGHYKLRWRFYFSTSDWEQLQTRLTAYIDVLKLSMQGLLTCVSGFYSHPNPMLQPHLTPFPVFMYYSPLATTIETPQGPSAPMPNLQSRVKKVVISPRSTNANPRPSPAPITLRHSLFP